MNQPERPYARYLIASEREEYKQGNGPDVECIHCAQAEDDERVIKKCLFEDEFLMVLLNIFPYNHGHLLVVPKRHVNSLLELEEDELTRMFQMVKRVEKLLRDALDLIGVNMGANLEKGAGESIQHLHIHLVPIYEHDRGFMETALDTKVMPESLDRTFEKLKEHSQILDDYQH